LRSQTDRRSKHYLKRLSRKLFAETISSTMAILAMIAVSSPIIGQTADRVSTSQPQKMTASDWLKSAFLLAPTLDFSKAVNAAWPGGPDVSGRSPSVPAADSRVLSAPGERSADEATARRPVHSHNAVSAAKPTVPEMFPMPPMPSARDIAAMVPKPPTAPEETYQARKERSAAWLFPAPVLDRGELAISYGRDALIGLVSYGSLAFDRFYPAGRAVDDTELFE
jgi:hypothetical protein